MQQLEIEAELSFVRSKVLYIESMIEILSKSKEMSTNLEIDPSRFEPLMDYLASQHTQAKIEQERLRNSLEKVSDELG